MDEELNLELPSSDEIEDLLNEANASLSQDEGTPTDVPVESKQTQQPSTEGQENRPGALGFAQDVAEKTIKELPQNLYEGVAPAVGVIDTLTDAYNMATGFNVPKLPEYEDKMSTAVRNISGLVLPSLGLRGMAIQAGTKLQAAGGVGPNG